MMHMMLQLEDQTVIADRKPLPKDPGTEWVLKIQDGLTAQYAEIECSDVQFGMLMLLAIAGEMGLPEAMVKQAYEVVEPLFKDLPKEVRIIP